MIGGQPLHIQGSATEEAIP
ncbi:unnamed protein product [Nezara viridula]|uniref:Uncharacterized protein n=1 Tax=Nezara viridula TaxID=85310 RepID=A0A9P0H0L4_NEZVI|nr:unnamed protein product [Nezara viridula]